jgi:hypothetical protein
MNIETLETIDLDALSAVTGGGKLWRKIAHAVKKTLAKVRDALPDEYDIEL